jgi:hypothetical protein
MDVENSNLKVKLNGKTADHIVDFNLDNQRIHLFFRELEFTPKKVTVYDTQLRASLSDVQFFLLSNEDSSEKTIEIKEAYKIYKDRKLKE